MCECMAYAESRDHVGIHGDGATGNLTAQHWCQAHKC